MGDYSRDISLRRSLGDGPYADSAATYGSEHPSAGAGLVFHIVADEADDGEVRFNFKRLYLSEGDLVGECFVCGFPGLFGILLADGYQAWCTEEAW